MAIWDFARIWRVSEELAERMGFEFTRKRRFNNIERTAGGVKQWKAVLSSTNGSQTDHRWPEHSGFYPVIPVEEGPICMARIGVSVPSSEWPMIPNGRGIGAHLPW